MAVIARTFNSSVGLKFIMAATGLALFGFLVAHLSGNLITFAGQDAFNTYAANMQSLGPVLWIGRLGLLFVFVLHVYSAVKLTAKNKKARPMRYVKENTVVASYASRTMFMTGLIVLFFLIFHLAHYTLYWVQPDFKGYTDALGRHDAYRMVVEGFSNPIAAGSYIIGMLIVGMHLSHGLQSMFQSVGINHPNINPFLRKVMPLLGWLLALGFISIPVCVMLGCIAMPEGMN